MNDSHTSRSKSDDNPVALKRVTDDAASEDNTLVESVQIEERTDEGLRVSFRTETVIAWDELGELLADTYLEPDSGEAND